MEPDRFSRLGEDPCGAHVDCSLQMEKVSPIDVRGQQAMRHVVMIAYHFPPEGNAGAYRPLRFVRQLPTFKWQPSIVTVDTDCFERYDPHLLKAVPADVETIRVRNYDPWQSFQAWRSNQARERLARSSPQEVNLIHAAHAHPLRSLVREWIRTLEAWCYQPDSFMGWIRPATRAVVALCSRKRIDTIWATAGPVSSFVAAQRASRLTGIPYVLDFRDAWTISFNAFEALQPEWAQRLTKKTMHCLLRDARSVVFRYATEAECFWRAYPGALESTKIHIIPNGFDGDVEPYEAPASKEKCHILYTGTLGDYRYDTFLQAIRAIKIDSPQLAKRLHIHFVGEGSDTLRPITQKLQIDDVVTWTEPLPFAAVNQLAKTAHALLVFGRYPTMQGYELFAGAKLFGYLKAGRPILGVLPEDETKKILRQVGVSTIADVESVPEIVSILRTLLAAWQEDRLVELIPVADACREFSAFSQTKLLVNALEGKMAPRPFVPGQFDVPPSLRHVVPSHSMSTHNFTSHWACQATISGIEPLYEAVTGLSFLPL